MNIKIDQNSVVPIGWALAGFGTLITFAVAGAFWMSSVDYRLSRIEEKLSIPAYHVLDWTLERTTYANDGSGLPQSLSELPSHDRCN